MIGTVVGNHRIVARVSEGGMGVVYRAEHVILGRPAAIKVLLPHYSGAREIVARFFNEARAASAIRHPGIVEIYDFGFLPDGPAYIVMEFLDGQTLSARLRRPMTELDVVAIGRQIASALSAAHDRGVIHRDLKPDNVILVPDPAQPERSFAKLVDFGIAKLADAGLAGHTRTNALMGTPAFMAPEQCRGARHVDHRTDLYALGCILYMALAGRPPFTARNPAQLIEAHLNAAPPPLATLTTVSPDLERLVMSLLAKRPDHRPASAAVIVAMFDRMAGPGAAVSPGANLVATVVARIPGGAAPARSSPPDPASPRTPNTLDSGVTVRPATTPPPPRRWWLLGAGAASVATAVAVAYVLGGAPSPQQPAGAPTPAAAPSARPAPPATPATSPAAAPDRPHDTPLRPAPTSVTPLAADAAPADALATAPPATAPAAATAATTPATTPTVTPAPPRRSPARRSRPRRRAR